MKLLLALLVSSAAFAGGEELYVARAFTEPIGTVKTEGPVCDAQENLYFCNMQQEGLTFNWKSANQGNIAKVLPDGKAEVFVTLPEGMRGNGMRFAPNGNLLVADQLGGHVLTVDMKTREVSVYFKFPDGSGSPNDLAIRSDGTLYVSMFKDGLWLIRPDRTGEKVASGFHNGIDLSPDEKKIYSVNAAYTVAADGSLSNPRKLLQLPPKSEGFNWDDGIRTDTAGNIYMARFGGPKADEPKGTKNNGAVHMFAPDGTLIRNVPMLAPEVTNLAFGGPDGKTVYVTHPGMKGFIASFRTEHPGRAWNPYQTSVRNP
jgi:sugar lactone lactonase YvrE